MAKTKHSEVAIRLGNRISELEKKTEKEPDRRLKVGYQKQIQDIMNFLNGPLVQDQEKAAAKKRDESIDKATSLEELTNIEGEHNLETGEALNLKLGGTMPQYGNGGKLPQHGLLSAVGNAIGNVTSGLTNAATDPLGTAGNVLQAGIENPMQTLMTGGVSAINQGVLGSPQDVLGGNGPQGPWNEDGTVFTPQSTPAPPQAQALGYNNNASGYKQVHDAFYKNGGKIGEEGQTPMQEYLNAYPNSWGGRDTTILNDPRLGYQGPGKNPYPPSAEELARREALRKAFETKYGPVTDEYMEQWHAAEKERRNKPMYKKNGGRLSRHENDSTLTEYGPQNEPQGFDWNSVPWDQVGGMTNNIATNQMAQAPMIANQQQLAGPSSYIWNPFYNSEEGNMINMENMMMNNYQNMMNLANQEEYYSPSRALDQNRFYTDRTNKASEDLVGVEKLLWQDRSNNAGMDRSTDILGDYTTMNRQANSPGAKLQKLAGVAPFLDSIYGRTGARGAAHTAADFQAFDWNNRTDASKQLTQNALAENTSNYAQGARNDQYLGNALNMGGAYWGFQPGQGQVWQGQGQVTPGYDPYAATYTNWNNQNQPPVTT